MAEERPDKKILLSVADGPEGIEIYTSEEEGMVDWSPAFPAVYIVVNTHDAMFKAGPFSLPAIYEQLVAALKCRPAGIAEKFAREFYARNDHRYGGAEIYAWLLDQEGGPIG